MFPVVVVPGLSRAAPVVCILPSMESVVEQQVFPQLIEVLLLTVQGVEALECNLKHTTFMYCHYQGVFANS